MTATAAGLRRSGIEPGDRVVLALLDSREFATAFLACLRIGAIAPVNPLPWATWSHRRVRRARSAPGVRARRQGSDELDRLPRRRGAS